MGFRRAAGFGRPGVGEELSLVRRELAKLHLFSQNTP